MEAEHSILNRIQRRQLKWYGHVLRMEDSRFPRNITSGNRMVGGEEEDRNNHEEPSDGLHEKQKYGKRHGRR